MGHKSSEFGASITIVIAARNAAATLAQTLDSVLRQTRTDWVALIVDDSSTDETCRIAAKYCATDNRFRILRIAAGSAAEARNYGASFAETPWIAFLDADDLYREEFLAEMLGLAFEAKDPARSVVYCSGQQMTPDGRIGVIDQPPQLEHLQHLRRACIFYTCALVMPRALFASVGGFSVSLKTAEDWDLWVRLFQAGGIPVAAEHPLVIYRLRPDSLVRTARSEQLFRDSREVIYRAHGVSSSAAGTRDIDRALFHVGLWHLGVSIGAKKADEDFVRDLPIPMDLDDGIVAAHLISGIASGACVFEEDWPQLWSRFRGEIGSSLAIIGSHRDRVLYELENRATVTPQRSGTFQTVAVSS